MRKLSLLLCIVVFIGCAPVLVGTGIVTGYILSNDSAMGNISIGYHQLWTVCKETLDYEGADIIFAKESAGVIKAKLSDVDITLKIDSASSDIQRLKVSARRYLLPKPYIAQDIFTKIVKSLE